jgi:RNA polymerase primary sigma factor
MEQDRVTTPTHSKGAADEHHHGITRLTRARLLNHQEEMDLARKVKLGGLEGRRAQHRLVESNMRLVVSIAKAYRASGIPIEDLVQEGAIGLMTAAERYDPDRGFRFSTYATQWIRQAIGRAVDNKAKAIRLPAHVSESLRKLDRVKAELRRETGDEPSHETIADRSGLSVRKVQALLNTTQDPISLDLPVGDEENTSLGSLLTDRNAPDPQSTLLDVEMVQEVDNILNSLDERERRVMRLRYGFDGDDALVLAQIGEQLNISRERVRQIEQHALKKLRNEAKKGRLREIV